MRDGGGTIRRKATHGGNRRTYGLNGKQAGGSTTTATGYTIRFETNGGSTLGNVKRAGGSVVDVSRFVPTRKGFTFGGWYLDAALTTKVTTFKLTKDTTLYARWLEGEMPFTDVAADAYYYEAVRWAVENNITSGNTATTFAPNAPCTRAQVVTFLWRALG